MHLSKLPIFEYFAKRLGVSPWSLTEIEALNPDWIARAERARLDFEVIVDYSPVMKSQDAFAAKLEHDFLRITLNGWVIEDSPDEDLATEFLIFHEIGHFLGLDEGASDRLGLWFTLKKRGDGV